MNYFEFYNLPESLNPDAQALRQKYYQLSKQYHPDFHANESAEKQAEILQLSTLNTQAYQTLSNPDKRLQYVLEQHGVLTEGKGNELPNTFLMEMMELNEEVMELQIDYSPAKHQALEQQLQQLEDLQLEQIQPAVNNFETASAEDKKLLLASLKEYYLKKRYLLRIRESLTKIAAP